MITAFRAILGVGLLSLAACGTATRVGEVSVRGDSYRIVQYQSRDTPPRPLGHAVIVGTEHISCDGSQADCRVAVIRRLLNPRNDDESDND